MKLSKEEKRMLSYAFGIKEVTVEEATQLNEQHGYTFLINDGKLVHIEVE